MGATSPGTRAEGTSNGAHVAAPPNYWSGPNVMQLNITSAWMQQDTAYWICAHRSFCKSDRDHRLHFIYGVNYWGGWWSTRSDYHRTLLWWWFGEGNIDRCSMWLTISIQIISSFDLWLWVMTRLKPKPCTRCFLRLRKFAAGFFFCFWKANNSF